MSLMSDVQVFLTKLGIYLIAQLEQLDEEPSCYLKNIYQITEDDEVVLTKWPKYTAQNDSLFFLEDFVTMVEPSPAVLDKYKEIIS
jgi:calcineurin-like phosphoesterase family protein